MLYILYAAPNAISSTLRKQKERSVSAYLVIALLSGNTLTLSSPGISIYLDILWMTSEYNLLSMHITQSPGETEQDVTIRRLDRERFWMLELGTMYPYGLNDRLQHVGNVSHSYV